MNTLSSLPQIVHKRAKRLGRGTGSKAGAKSGRGTTRHQKARTSIPLFFEGGQNRMIKKFPLLRGKGKNKSVQLKRIVINMNHLNTLKKNTVVNIQQLISADIVDKSAYQAGVKIVAGGKLKVSLQVALPTSVRAKAMIEKAGGKIISL